MISVAAMPVAVGGSLPSCPPFRPTSGERFAERIFALLLSIRPTQLGVLAKKLARIKRRHMPAAHGCVYWADPVSVFGLQLVRTGVYEPELTELLLRLLRPGEIFIDVGGNEGYFSILAASRGCTVHCIEPQSRLLPIIRTNVRINSLGSITIHQLALSSAAGTSTLFLRPNTNTGASSFFRYWRLGWAAETVPTETIDGFLSTHRVGHVRIVKIDCEGAESLVVDGAATALTRQAFDLLAVEYHPRICGAEKCRGTHDRLSRCGYHLARFRGIHLYYLPRCEDDLNRLPGVKTNCQW